MTDWTNLAIDWTDLSGIPFKLVDWSDIAGVMLDTGNAARFWRRTYREAKFFQKEGLARLRDCVPGGFFLRSRRHGRYVIFYLDPELEFVTRDNFEEEAQGAGIYRRQCGVRA